MARKDSGPIPAELLDQLLVGRDPKTVLESGGLIGDLKKALAERMLNAELVGRIRHQLARLSKTIGEPGAR